MSDDPTADWPGGDQDSSSGIWPRQVGPYHLKRIIAAGGMGTVYEAVQQQPRRSVALKLMRPGLSSPAALRRFEAESQILARLRHPNIAQVYDAGTQVVEGVEVPYFAMEYIPGAKPIDRYASEKGLDTRQKLSLFQSLCDAVHHGHQRGIIHRDLKPGNILVDSTGQVKVIDFGVARTTDADLVLTTMQTEVGQLVGTLQYMSPEQTEGDPQNIDPRSDVYALGVVLYELLTGRLPYDVKQCPPHDATRLVREGTPTRMSVVETKFRGDLETIVSKALEKDPSRRYGSAHALAGDIQRFLNDEPIIARPASVFYTTRKRVQQAARRQHVAAFAVVVLGALLLTEFVAVPMVYDWTGLNQVYNRFVARLPWPAATSAWEHVRLITIDPEDRAVMAELAQEAGIDGVDGASMGTWRPLHGYCMSKLARAECQTLVWDVTFRSEGPRDAEWVSGAKAINERGGTVIVGVSQWWGNGEIGVSPVIMPHVRWGGVTTNFNADHPWQVHQLVQRGAAEPMPSIAMAGALAHRQPGKTPQIDLHVPQTLADVGFVDGGENGKASPEVEEIEFSWVLTDQQDDRFGLLPGDTIAYSYLLVPSDESLAESTRTYRWAMDASVDDIRSWLGSRALVIGYSFPGDPEDDSDDWWNAPDGRTLAGCVGWAAALDALLADHVFRLERLGFSRFLLLPLCGLAGLLVGLCWGHQHLVRLGVVTFGVGIVWVAAAAGYHSWHYLFNPITPTIAFVLTAEGSAAIARLKRVQPRKVVST